jgi:hypothetical protein
MPPEPPFLLVLLRPLVSSTPQQVIKEVRGGEMESAPTCMLKGRGLKKRGEQRRGERTRLLHAVCYGRENVVRTDMRENMRI